MIEYIIFDLSEVFIRGILGVEKEIAKISGLDEKSIKRCLKGEKGERLYPFFEGRQSEEDYLADIVAKSNGNLSMDTLKLLIRDYFTEIPGTSAVLRKLKKKGHPIGLLSDHAREWVKDIEAKCDFMQLFDVRCYSFESGHTKLVPQSFEYALSKLNADPEKTLFIDDYYRNLEVAKSAGIRYVHLFTDAPSLEKILSDLGLL